MNRRESDVMVMTRQLTPDLRVPASRMRRAQPATEPAELRVARVITFVTVARAAVVRLYFYFVFALRKSGELRMPPVHYALGL